MPHLRGSACALLLVLFLPLAAPAAPVLPGGIVDLTGRTGFFAGSAGIDAISLARGDLLWSTSEAQQPLLAAADRLYALALTNSNFVYIRGFDLLNGGKRVYQSSRVDFPRWVVTGEAPAHSFQCTWRREKAILHLHWQARAWSDVGPAKEAAGDVRIDLDGGTVVMGAIGPFPPPAAARPRAQLEKLSVRWRRSIGGQLHVLVQEDVRGGEADHKKRLVLRTWNEQTSKEGKACELLRGTRPVVMQGMDGIQVWLRNAAPSPDELGDEKAKQNPWMVFSVLDGGLVARVPFVPGTREAALFAGRAYCLVAAPSRTFGRTHTLHVIDLESGKTLWKRPLSSKAISP